MIILPRTYATVPNFFLLGSNDVIYLLAFYVKVGGDLLLLGI